MDTSALQHIYDSIPDDQKRKFVLDTVKWLLGKGWEKLRPGDKKKAAPEVRQIVEASMAEIERFDPRHERLIHAVKRGAPKKAAVQKSTAGAYKKAPAAARKHAVSKKASGAEKRR